ncbi:MAG: endolytic transglycosylase MltG, partial [Actinomycetota bacterium]
MSLDPAPPPPTFSRLGRVGAIIALVVVAGVAVVGGASYLGRQVGGALGGGSGSEGIDVEPGQDVEVVIPTGASAQDIAAILAGQGVVASATDFEAAVRSAGAAGDLQAGTYLLLTGMQPADVLSALREGPITTALRVTIPEGRRVTETIEILAEHTGIPTEEFAAALEEGEVTTELADMDDSPRLEDWEGLLFPDTYEFSQSASAADILQRLASTMERRVDSVDWSGLEESGYDVYEGIVIGSLIETEVRVADERPLVSSVIYNRLEEGMPLQIDATVLYAVGSRSPEDFDPEIDSPYNTYQ